MSDSFYFSESYRVTYKYLFILQLKNWWRRCKSKQMVTALYPWNSSRFALIFSFRKYSDLEQLNELIDQKSSIMKLLSIFLLERVRASNSHCEFALLRKKAKPWAGKLLWSAISYWNSSGKNWRLVRRLSETGFKIRHIFFGAVERLSRKNLERSRAEQSGGAEVSENPAPPLHGFWTLVWTIAASCTSPAWKPAILPAARASASENSRHAIFRAPVEANALTFVPAVIIHSVKILQAKVLFSLSRKISPTRSWFPAMDRETLPMWG